jgi:hypothetical protein
VLRGGPGMPGPYGRGLGAVGARHASPASRGDKTLSQLQNSMISWRGSESTESRDGYAESRSRPSTAE